MKNFLEALSIGTISKITAAVIVGVLGYMIKKHQDKKIQQKLFYETLSNNIKLIMDISTESELDGNVFFYVENIIIELSDTSERLFNSCIVKEIKCLLLTYQKFMNEPYGDYGNKFRDILKNNHFPDSLGLWQDDYKRVQNLQQQLQEIYYEKLEPKLKKVVEGIW